MSTDADREPTRNSTQDQDDADRQARARLADPDIGSPEEGEPTIDDDPHA